LFIILVLCYIYKSTVKLVIRGHLWDKDGWSFNKCDIVEKRFNSYDCSMTGQETYDLFIQVTAKYGDYMDLFDCVWITANLTTSPSELTHVGFNVQRKRSIKCIFLNLYYKSNTIYIYARNINVPSLCNLSKLMSLSLQHWQPCSQRL
jgi:hypothetical protein